MAERLPDLTRATLAVLVVGLLLLCSLWIVEPFLEATVWASTIVVATWPLLLRVQRALGGSRAAAVAVTTVVILIVFVAPFWFATSIILSRANQLIGLAQAAATFRIPPSPHWVAELPLIGPDLTLTWDRLQDESLARFAPQLAPYAGRVTQWFVGLIGSFGLLVLQFLLTVAIAAILYARGETAALLVQRLAHRLAGARGQEMVVLAGHAIRAVAIGVMVTALVESAVGGLGLELAGLPLATVLTAVMFVFCLAQAGPGVVLIPAVIWMYLYDDFLDATLLLVISLVAITIDNLLRPFLIRKESDMPMLLVLAGVIGGLSAYGLVGIFVGPAVLAVSFTMLQAWLAEDPLPPVAAAAIRQAAAPRALPAAASDRPAE